MCQGALDDPYAEFMIQEDKVLMTLHVGLIRPHYWHALAYMAFLPPPPLDRFAVHFIQTRIISKNFALQLPSVQYEGEKICTAC